MTQHAQAERSVNRLLDIVVEEVSLVDRAANAHRFLIVKRDTPMADTETDTDLANEGGDLNDEVAAEDTGGAPDSSIDPLLATAVTALEGLTRTVELLGSLGTNTADVRLVPLAGELQASAEALLARAGVARSEVSAETNNKASENNNEATFEAHLAAARELLSQLASLSAAKPTPPEPPPEPPKTPALPHELRSSLAVMSESFRTLAETVKEQQQRLARVEKQFGLPNSASSSERVRKAEPEEVGWPMDLNHPMDRESVDKAVSFHDL